MIILAIECATRTVSVALLAQREILAELFLDVERGHAETLLPAAEGLLSLAGMTIRQADLLVCTTGPGSFTGVRIGMSTIKGLAIAAGKPIVGVSTLAALAMNAAPWTDLICPLLDARKNQVYAGLYRLGPDAMPEAVVPDRLTDVDRLLRELAGEKVQFVGEGAVLYRDRIQKNAGGLTNQWATVGQAQLRASSVALIGLLRYEEGQIDDPLTFSPRYLRLSEAEANREQALEAGP